MKDIDKKLFEASNIQEAYEKISAHFSCSITELEIEIIQQPTKGFLGFGRKNAIVEVVRQYSQKHSYKKQEAKFNSNIKIEDVSNKLVNNETIEEPKSQNANVYSSPKVETKEKIFDNFYEKDNLNESITPIIIKKSDQEIIDEIKEKVTQLFKSSCFDISDIKVEKYDYETIYIEFNGEDSALLIGKEGYRYKALSYILFNWINEKYGKMLRLEVAEFLKNQEESMNIYLQPIIETIKETGTYKTKPLDGILVHIALTKLREVFPNKYVAVKTNQRGDKYILVNEYRTLES